MKIWGGNKKVMYINGAGGAVAVYQNNVSSRRYYFIKDQIGNTRVMVGDTGMVESYTSCFPFGETHNSYVAYNEPLKFTGKERDNYRNFRYDYFGARYYDPKTGTFNTIDKAAQLIYYYII